MKPNRVPDDLLQAAGDAIRAWYAGRPDHNSYLDDRTQMRLVIAAALTVHNEQVEQPLRERADAAEAQLKAVMQYTHEIGEVQAGLPSYEAAVARAGYWQALQRIAAQGVTEWQGRAEAAERTLAHQRDTNRGLAKNMICTMERATNAEHELAELRTTSAEEIRGLRVVATTAQVLADQRGVELAELRDEWGMRVTYTYGAPFEGPLSGTEDGARAVIAGLDADDAEDETSYVVSRVLIHRKASNWREVPDGS